MKQMMKKMIADLEKRISIVNAYIKKQMKDLDFYNYFGYTEHQEITIHNLDLSWSQIDMYKRQLKELKRDYKGSK